MIDLPLPERRKIISSFLLTILVGFAFKNMIDSVFDNVLSNGLTINNSFLTVSFFFVVIRFFIGNQLHLFERINSPGFLWLYDTIIIVVESIILILLGKVCLVEYNLEYIFGFKELLVMLLCIDITWVISQAIVVYRGRKKNKQWAMEIDVPWKWAFLNLASCLLLIFFECFIGSLYSVCGLWFVLILNFLAFFIDVIHADIYNSL